MDDSCVEPRVTYDKDQIARSEFWKEEVEALSGREFANPGEALHELIEKVLARFHLDGSDRDETRDFLLLLFDTDDAIKEGLAKVVKIRR